MNGMTETTTLSSKYQIVIPQSVRNEHGWRPGQRFAFIPKASGVTLVPIPDVDSLRGSAAGADPSGFRDRSERF